MLEMAKYVDQAEADQLISDAKRMIKALYDHCAVKDPKISNGQLLNGPIAAAPRPTAAVSTASTNAAAGRLLLLQALTRLSKDWECTGN